MNRKKILRTVAAILLTASLSGTAGYAVGVPSLFHNDEAWYKDGAVPLVLRDDVYYVPAELFGMFEKIRVETPGKSGNNLLIWNTRNDSYISILFDARRAAVNGRILENIAIFRDSGILYVDAMLVAETLNIEAEILEHEDGGISMRLYDENRLLTTEELLAPYFPEEDDEFAGLGEEEYLDLKRIFVICREPAEGEPYSALKWLREHDMGYTLFLEGDTSTDSLLSALAGGEYGILLPDNTASGDVVAALDGINASFGRITQYQTHLTMATGDYDADESLRRAGYCPVLPDFTVNASADPNVVFADMLEHLGTNDYCVLLLEDCPQIDRMIELMNLIDREKFITSNLGN